MPTGALPVTSFLAAATLAAGCGASGSRPSVAEGRRVFVSAGCGGCHTLAAARAHGKTGPDLDTSERLDRAGIRSQLDVGEGGMPSYTHRLTARQKAAVTEFVYASTR
jgi:mono/diheme cytochrome c family protein